MTRFNCPKKIIPGDESGFTLLEAIIALFVFTVGVLATVTMQTSSLNANMIARHTTEGASAAASVIEHMRPLDYQNDPELSEGDNSLPNQNQYTISYNVQRDAIIDNTMLIQVTVNWTVRGRPKSINLISIKPDII